MDQDQDRPRFTMVRPDSFEAWIALFEFVAKRKATQEEREELRQGMDFT
ncbi:hypothetical protein [Rhodoblastus sp.]